MLLSSLVWLSTFTQRRRSQNEVSCCVYSLSLRDGERGYLDSCRTVAMMHENNPMSLWIALATKLKANLSWNI